MTNKHLHYYQNIDNIFLSWGENFFLSIKMFILLSFLCRFFSPCVLLGYLLLERSWNNHQFHNFNILHNLHFPGTLWNIHNLFSSLFHRSLIPNNSQSKTKSFSLPINPLHEQQGDHEGISVTWQLFCYLAAFSVTRKEKKLLLGMLKGSACTKFQISTVFGWSG